MNDDETRAARAGGAAIRRLDALGLNRGSTGNLSHRCARDGVDGMLITPTGMGADDLRAQDMVWMGVDGTVAGRLAAVVGMAFPPGRATRRADLQAVVHTHSVNATALACLERELPPFHYMVAVAGADTVPCTPVPHLRQRGACRAPWRRP